MTLETKLTATSNPQWKDIALEIHRTIGVPPLEKLRVGISEKHEYIRSIYPAACSHVTTGSGRFNGRHSRLHTPARGPNSAG